MAKPASAAFDEKAAAGSLAKPVQRNVRIPLPGSYAAEMEQAALLAEAKANRKR